MVLPHESRHYAAPPSGGAADFPQEQPPVRYALYFTPPASDPLTLTAAAWLGRNAFTGAPLEQPAVAGFDAAALAGLTADPRRYGFHATLKAPFTLAEGRSEAELVTEIGRFSAEAATFEIPEVIVGRLGSFFALVPGDHCEDLQAFAGEVVRRFERFRAPLTSADIARRRPDELSAEERQNLVQWGYPYVFDTFRFHMTLTGRVPAERRDAVEAVLLDRFSAFHGRPLPIGGLALFREPARGADFTVHSLFPLGGEANRKTA
jgi:putative phosphonate metabolism protein